MTERWQNGALIALRFFAVKCNNHMISGENQQKMTGKSVERQKISAGMRVFLNSAQKIRRTEIFAERRTAQNENQNGNRRKNQHKLSSKPVEIRRLERDIMLKQMNVNALSFHCAKVLMYENKRLWSVL